jgi:hypothetical protein
MSRDAVKLSLALGVMVVFLAGAADQPQKLPVGHATDFTSESYFEPPNERQIKLRMSGSEALPLPGGWQDIRDLKIETFDVSGKAGMIVRAPQCNYSLFDREANSAGQLELESGDGKFRIEGEGFLWRQDGNSLIISNHVHTVIKGGKIEI